MKLCTSRWLDDVRGHGVAAEAMAAGADGLPHPGVVGSWLNHDVEAHVGDAFDRFAGGLGHGSMQVLLGHGSSPTGAQTHLIRESDRAAVMKGERVK